MKSKMLLLGSLAIIGGSAFAFVKHNEKQKKAPVVSLEIEKEKLPSVLTTVDAPNKAGQDFTADAVGTNVTTKFKKITEVASTGANKFYREAFSVGVWITAKVKTVYDLSKNEIVLTVIVKSGDKSASRDVTIKFESISLQTEIDKLQDIIVAKSADTAANNYNFATKHIENVDIIEKVKQIKSLYSNHRFSHGANKLLKSAFGADVKISEAIVRKEYDMATAKLVLLVKLVKDNTNIISGTNTKEITITFGGEDLSAELAKLKNEITNVDSKAGFTGAKGDDVITAYKLLDIMKSGKSLTTGVTIAEAKIRFRVGSWGIDPIEGLVITIKLTKSTPNGIKYGTNVKDVRIDFDNGYLWSKNMF